MVPNHEKEDTTMTFDDVFKQLATIDKAAVSLLKAACPHPDEGLPGSVRPLAD